MCDVKINFSFKKARAFQSAALYTINWPRLEDLSALTANQKASESK
jgi:hypothetical protein